MFIGGMFTVPSHGWFMTLFYPLYNYNYNGIVWAVVPYLWFTFVVVRNMFSVLICRVAGANGIFLMGTLAKNK
jgi:hypothetical protein